MTPSLRAFVHRCYRFTPFSINFAIPVIFLSKRCGGSSSSKAWMERHVTDQFVKEARYNGYRARSAYKLIEIDDKFKLLRPGMKVLDCGAAPGGWTQVLVQRVVDPDPERPARGLVLALDKNRLAPVPGAQLLTGADLTLATVRLRAAELLGGRGAADGILSDMAPNASGVAEADHRRIVALAYEALRFGADLLAPGRPGTFFLCKLWDGAETARFVTDLEVLFERVNTLKPKASRNESAEIFVLARNYLGIK